MAKHKVQQNRKLIRSAELLELYDLCGLNEHNERNLKNVIRALDIAESVSFIMIDDRLVCFGRLVSNGFRSEIQDIMTHPDFRRQGLGTLVVRDLIEQAETTSPYIRLVDESGVEGFYEKLGFEKPKREKTYYMMLED